MPSSIAWLDTSEDEQRRVREMIQLFTQPESRDELGIGQIRDAFSNALFPGSSTLHTRARYFLLVPWAYQHAERKKSFEEQTHSQARISQQHLVKAISGSKDAEGLIGARAGDRVKSVPSDVYWNGLVTYGIRDRTHRAGIRQVVEDLAEREHRAPSGWHPTIPDPPTGFPHKRLDEGFALTGAEARWLRERILESVPGTLLAHVVGADRRPDPDSGAPWLDSLCASVEGPARDLLLHAQRFSLVMDGASRLYNVLIAEAYENAGRNRVESPVDRHRQGYLEWVADVERSAPLLSTWNEDEFWELVTGLNSRISFHTQNFVREWTAGIRCGAFREAIEDRSHGGMREVVKRRESRVKGAQSRLTNSKLLGQWSGASGLGALTYRWGTVRRIATDIHEGLARA